MYAGKNEQHQTKKNLETEERPGIVHVASPLWTFHFIVFLVTTLFPNFPHSVFRSSTSVLSILRRQNAFQNPPLSFFILSSNPLPQYSQTILSPFLSLHPSISLLPHHFLSFLFLPFTSPFLVADSPPIRGSSRSQQPRDWERNWRWSTRKWTIIRNWRRRIGEPRVE